MSADEIVWGDPPARVRRHNRGRVRKIVAELKQRRGKWALVHTGVHSVGGGYQRQRLRDMGCETDVDLKDDGSVDIYARWPEDAS